MMKGVFNKRGVTLTEMIVAIAVFSIMVVAVTTVFAPMMNTFRRANNLAEANTLLDNIAAIMLADLNSAVNQVVLDGYGQVALDDDYNIIKDPGVRYTPADGLWIFSSRYLNVRYVNSNEGIRRGVGGAPPAPLLEGRFFSYISFEPIHFSPEGDVIYLTLTLIHATDNWEPLTRTYAIRPMGMQ